MLSRIILSLVFGLLAWIITFIVGLILTLVPLVSPVGFFIEQIAVIVGLISGLVYFINGRTTLF